MGKKFTHFIACRYNHDLYTNNTYKVKDRDGWMNDRLLKFKKLLDSLNNQTCLEFKFLIFIDPNTPILHKEILIKFLEDNLKKINWEVSEIQFNIFLKNLKVDTEFIITSRIDNDDEYLPKFVETIQKAFNGKEEVIDVKGVQFDTINNQKYTSGRLTPNSPFISLVEKSNNIKSVYFCSHSNMCKHFKCRFSNDTEVHYIQNIHNNNIMNKIIGSKI